MRTKQGGNIASILQTGNSNTVATYSTDFSARLVTCGLISELRFPDLHTNVLSTEPFSLLTYSGIRELFHVSNSSRERRYICAVEHGIWQTASKPSTRDCECHL